MSKKNPKQAPAPSGVNITQRKRDRVAAILAVALGLVSIREGGAVLLGVTIPDYPVLPWLVWYNVVLGAVSVVAGAGIWTRRDWSHPLALNILTLHAIVFAGLFALYKSGQTVALHSIFAMLFRTFTWLVIYSLIRWKRSEN